MYHEIGKKRPNMTRKNHIKIFFKVGAKIAKIDKQKIFFDPSQKIKPSDQKVPLYTIYEDFYQLKLICTHQAHQTPQKTRFYFNKIMFFGGFGVPSGCKSILIARSLHISYITKLFGLRVFVF